LLEIYPLARQYGMSWEEFWHKDTRLFNVCQKAYYRNLYETAWLNGLYVNISIQNIAENIFAKKGTKPREYPREPHDPYKKAVVVTKENLESEHRSLLNNQNDFIRSVLKNKK
jgi:hypothetical protein